MKRELSPHNVVILGGTSKIWRLMQPFWANGIGSKVNTIVVGRRDAEGIDVVAEKSCDIPPSDAVIALWGVTGGDADQLAQNSHLVEQAHEIARASGARVVFHASSAAVYSPSQTPISETSETDPRHPYGCAKLEAEGIEPDAGVTGIHLRLGNVAGADSLFRSMATRSDIQMHEFSDGRTPRRSYIAPDDLARVFEVLLTTNPDALPRVLNVSGPKPVEMGSIVEARGIPMTRVPAGPEALPLQHLDTSRLQALGASIPSSSDPDHLAQFQYPSGSAA